jgi:hypothetical protein
VRDVTWPVADHRYAPGQHEEIHAYSFDATTVNVAAIQSLIDAAATYGYWLTLIFHEITDAASSGGSCSTADFTTIVNYVNSKGMAVKTVNDVLDLA